ncbi:MAG: hypothetical protein KDJ62_06105 [Rhodobiaceae bacterium]|nr:hypothetical protein [Rhodobiaceae bacterium]
MPLAFFQALRLIAALERDLIAMHAIFVQEMMSAKTTGTTKTPAKTGAATTRA